MYKKFIYAIMLISISFNIFSQNTSEYHKKNVLKINPLGGLASAIPISFERFLFKNLFSIVGQYTYIYNQSGSGQTTYNTNGYIAMPQVRHYFYNDSINRASIFLGAFYTYEQFNNETKDRYSNVITGTATGHGGGLIFGTQWFLKNNIIFDFFIGPGYIEYIKNDNYDNNVAKGGFLVSFTGPKNTSTKIKLGFSIGYSF